MHIDTNLLITWGAVSRKYRKNEFIFYEGDQCRFYHQIEEGKVKMCCYNDEGRQFIQGLFGPGESFGEPPIFINEVYPASAYSLFKSIRLHLLPGLVVIGLYVLLTPILNNNGTLGIPLTSLEKTKIIAFLKTLTDNQYLTESRFSQF